MPQSHDPSPDLTRTTLSIGVIGLLICSCAYVVRPFVSAFVWATMIVLSTWPVLEYLQAKFRGKRGLAACVMTLALLLLLILPMAFAVGALVGNIDRIGTWVSSLNTLTIPSPPEWLAGIPLVGAKFATGWKSLALQGPEGLRAHVLPYANGFIRWLIAQLGGAGAMILQFLLTVIICAILYMNGETAARGVRKFAIRLAGPRGDRVILLAGSAIRGVATGIVVTAIVQVLIAGAGLLITAVPGALLLSAIILIMCLAQLGPALVMIPAVIWQFYTGGKLSGFILLAFALVSMTIDNVVRPILIRKGADLPLVLIFTGVIGGMVTMGIMGIFLGPVILAVTFDLLKEWVETGNEPEAVEAYGVPQNATTTAG